VSAADLTAALAHMVERVDAGAPVNEAHADTCSAFVLSAREARKLLAMYTDRDVVSRIELSGDAVGDPVAICIRGTDDSGYTVSVPAGFTLPGSKTSQGFFGPLAFAEALDYACATVKWFHAEALEG
jgi:hypothetical protein